MTSDMHAGGHGVICADVSSAPTEPDGGSEALDTTTAELSTLGTAEVGLWEAGPGGDTDLEVDEVFLVLAGAGTVAFEDGSSVELRPGVVVRLHAGDRTTWSVAERIKKLYVVPAAPVGEGVATPAPSSLADARRLASDALTVPLTRESKPGHWVDGGWPDAHMEHLTTAGDIAVYLWEITPGIVTDIERDECLLVLSGSGELRFDSGQAVALEPGLLVRLRAGERTEWTVRSTLRTLAIAQAT